LAIKQILQTIQNKIKLDKGISRRPVDATPGYLGDMNNFEYKNGAVVLRNGSRVMNHAEDNLWYDIKSFKICGTNVVMGLNYKRELWAWLDKWPETDFKVCNSSPFRTYRHVDLSGTVRHDRHFSFEKGNKFWLKEDAFSVIVANDYGEIFRIMKSGFFRITDDGNSVDADSQIDAIQNARDFIILDTGRLYLDIKEATNKLFEQPVFLADEYIRRSWRITGETKFARVNELGVISELSEPINIEGYRHVAVSLDPILNYDKVTKSLPVKGVVHAETTAAKNTKIYGLTEDSIAIVANEGEKWEPVNPFDETSVEVSAIILEVKEDGIWYESDGTSHVLTEGIYMCLSNKDDGSIIDLDDAGWNFNAVKMNLKSPDHYKYDDAGSGSAEINVPSLWKNQERIFKVGAGYRMISVQKIDSSKKAQTITLDGSAYGFAYPYIFPNIKSVFPIIKWEGNIDIGDVSSWIKLQDISGESPVVDQNSTPLLIMKPNVSAFAGDYDSPKIIANGKMFCVDLTLKTQTDITTKYGWSENDIVGFEIEFDGTQTYNEWQNIGFDCWKLLSSSTQSVAVEAIDFVNKRAIMSGLDDDTDIITISETPLTSNSEGRIAVWNDNYICGISQRAFRNGTEIFYKGSFGDEVDNINMMFDTLNVCYLPLMTLDSTGLRRIPMTAPIIRRAMRNPQHLAIAGGTVYSVEDNKIWTGSVDDFMLTDYIPIHSSVINLSEFDSGVIISTKEGLFYAEKGQPLRSVVGSELIIPRFMGVCSAGALVVCDNDIYIVYKHVTEANSWYPALAKISDAVSDMNLQGEIKSVSIGKNIYIADDWTVWIYDAELKIWAGTRNYKSRIHRLFEMSGNLGIAFDEETDRRKSFDKPGGQIS